MTKGCDEIDPPTREVLSYGLTLRIDVQLFHFSPSLLLIAHLEALSSPDGAQRFAISCPEGSYTWQDALDEIHASKLITDEERKFAHKGNPGEGKKVVQNTLDPSLSVKVLGMKYKNLKETMEGSVLSIRDYEKRNWKGLPSDKIAFENLAHSKL